MNPAYFDSIFRHHKLVSWVSCRLIKWLRSRARILANISIVEGEKEQKEKKTGERKRDVLQSISSLLCAYTIMYVTIQSFMTRFCVTMRISFLAFPLFVEKEKPQQLLTWFAASTGMDWKCWVYGRWRHGLCGDGDVWRDDGEARTNTQGQTYDSR